MTPKNKLNEFECYKLYHALRLYFKGQYDFFKYQSGIKVDPKKYEKRPDRYWFKKLSKNYSKTELINLIVANIVYSKVPKWVGDLINDDAVEVYQNWIKIQESLMYRFSEDCKFLKNFV